ncbi:MAG: mechanosensitive ion channel [Bacteroidia bacterium]
MEQYQLNLLQTLGGFVVLVLLRGVVSKIAHRRLSKAKFSLERQKITLKASNFLFTIVFIVFLAGVWGFRSEQVLAFVTSILAVLGIGFFAQWSLLSNITAGLLLYFNHPLKIGDEITIVDAELPLTGQIIDISLFFLHIRDKENVVYTMPNTIVIQKTITINQNDE